MEKINCPQCAFEFHVEDVLSQRIEEKYREKLSGQISEMEKAYQQKDVVLQRREQELKAQSADMQRQIEEKAKLEADAKAAEIKRKLAGDYEVKIKSLTEAESDAKQKLAEMKATLLENEKLKRKIEEQKQDFELEYERKLTQQLAQQMKEKSEAIRLSEKETFDKLREQEKEETEKKVRELEKKLEGQSKLADDYEVKIKSLADAESEAKQKLAEMKATLLENEKLKRKIEEQKQDFEIEYERKLTQQLAQRMKEKSDAIRLSEKENFDKLREQEKEEAAKKIQELEKKLDDQTKLAAEMKRKAEQGSTQLQGEVQELALERMLRDLYEREGDLISEVKKGARGADVLHTVKTRLGDVCGKIYYESKRTQSFNNDWLQKLRDDNIEVGADVLVLVTETMPTGHDRFFLRDGVWICSLWEVKALSLVLRDGIQRVYDTRIVQHGKETKMEEIYEYLTSKEFAAQFGAILEGFKSLQDNFSKEKLRMEQIWKERDKQLDKVLRNAARFYGSIRHIAGRSIPEMKMLEDDTPPLLEG